MRGYIVAIASLLAGASAVHMIYKPDLRIPTNEYSSSTEEQKTK